MPDAPIAPSNYTYEDFEGEPKPIQPAMPRPSTFRAPIVSTPGRGLTTQQAFDVARQRGCSKTKEAFRSWSKRNPAECERIYRLRVLENSARDNTVPSYEDLL